MAHWIIIFVYRVLFVFGKSYDSLKVNCRSRRKSVSYAIRYPAPGNPELAGRIQQLIGKSSIRAALSADRGFDHGLFIPLTIMYPEADIPCLQISLCKSLAPQEHLQLGKALAPLRQDNLLVVGSGFSFHNLRAFFQKPTEKETSDNETFQQWLIETCTSRQLSAEDREKRMTEWEKAPAARYCHPREEHLLPLHVCCGMAGEAATQTFTLHIMGKTACALIW